MLFFCSSVAFASDDIQKDIITTDKATQIIEMEDNKINVIVMKQPLNENLTKRLN